MEMEQRQSRCSKLKTSAFPDWICTAREDADRFTVLGVSEDHRNVKVADVRRATAFWADADFVARLLLEGGVTSCERCQRQTPCPLPAGWEVH